MQKVIKRGCWSCWLNKQDRTISFNFYALNLVHFMLTLRIFHSFGTNSAQVNNWNYSQNDAKQEKEPGGPSGEQRITTPSTEAALRGIPFLSTIPRRAHTENTKHTEHQEFTIALRSSQQQKPVPSYLSHGMERAEGTARIKCRAWLTRAFRND